jgi:5-methylcytosine-specific restriction endonuclease McrA
MALSPAERSQRYRDRYPERSREAVRALRQRRQAELNAVKASKGCGVCGETDPIVLDFDHLDPLDKNPKLRRHGANWGMLSRPEVEEELLKVQVLCANDHRRKTAQEEGRCRT